jgi:hypothetical protein
MFRPIFPPGDRIPVPRRRPDLDPADSELMADAPPANPEWVEDMLTALGHPAPTGVASDEHQLAAPTNPIREDQS